MAGDEESPQCDDCMKLARPWQQGRAAMRYAGLGRKLVLGLKHNDRQDIAVAAAKWLAQSARPLLKEQHVLVPVPLHRTRLLTRRYNQSALLCQHLALRSHSSVLLDGLIRPQKTQPLDGVGVEERFARLAGAITPNPKRVDMMADKPVLLVDDVMTSGATLAAATEACMTAGAQRVDVLVLARVCKDD